MRRARGSSDDGHREDGEEAGCHTGQCVIK